MNDRRRFLHVLGVTTAAAALPACGSDTTTGSTTSGAGGGDGAGGAGGGGGEGGAGSTGSTATASSTSSATSSTGTGGVDCPPDGVAIGVPADFASDGLHIVPGTKVLIGRDAMGLYALTSVCTHEFCDMDEKNGGKSMGTVTAQGITCNCHGSKFDHVGTVVKGPAGKALKAYALALGCDGKLYVDKTTVVANTIRLDA